MDTAESLFAHPARELYRHLARWLLDAVELSASERKELLQSVFARGGLGGLEALKLLPRYGVSVLARHCGECPFGRNLAGKLGAGKL